MEEVFRLILIKRVSEGFFNETNKVDRDKIPFDEDESFVTLTKINK